MNPLLKRLLLGWSLFSWACIAVFAGTIIYNVLFSPLASTAETLGQIPVLILGVWLVGGFLLGLWYLVRTVRKEEKPYAVSVWIPFGLVALLLVGVLISLLVQLFLF